MRPGSAKALRLEAALDRVAGLELDGLRAMWLKLHGRPAPETFRTPLLRAAVAYTLQEQALGGLKPAIKRLLRRVADQADSGMRNQASVTGEATGSDASMVRVPDASPSAEVPTPRQPPMRIKPGTRLLRVWQGRTHEVEVEAEGVRYHGQTYRSLSEIARLITGQRWSGPLFFGLKGRAETRTGAGQ